MASKTAGLTGAALLAFAANSVLCRIALRDTAIDPASFSTIRIVSGALVLAALVLPRQGGTAFRESSWVGAALLSLYAVPFAYAYTQLSAGTGALLLFGCVQVTMLAAAVAARERMRAVQWGGALAAAAGLMLLVFPGLAAPPPVPALLMATAGASWGAYSLHGRGAADPVAQTMGNFVRATPMAAAVSVGAVAASSIDRAGVLLAITSGAITSGLGYVAWYGALRRLSRTQAAVVQLAVPPLAPAGGILFLGEAISVRLVAASALVLGGIAAVFVARR